VKGPDQQNLPLSPSQQSLPVRKILTILLSRVARRQRMLLPIVNIAHIRQACFTLRSGEKLLGKQESAKKVQV
jgi:hypothetical protein